jgi:ADP-ribose pyrophosphatase YjhB (NUDIX family)
MTTKEDLFKLLNNDLKLESSFLAGNPNALILSVCVCAIREDGKVLAVARRGTTDQWGLPGGKVDPGEDAVDALVREVWEESFIKLDKNKLVPVFNRKDAKFFVITYLYNGTIKDIPKQGDAGPAAWVTWEQLIGGPFGKYNAKLKETLGL